MKSIFPFLKWEKSLSLDKKLYITLNSFASIFMIVYLCVYFFSYMLYKHKIENSHITVYTNFLHIEHYDFKKLLEIVEDRLEKSPLYCSDYHVDIHIVDNNDLFTFLSFFMDMDAFNLKDRIFIKLLKNDQKLYGYLYEEMVHEILHSFQDRKYGGVIQSKLNIPFWVREGYPVFFSRKQLISATEARRLLGEYYSHGMSNLSIADKYQFSGILVKHAIEKMHKSVDDLHLGKVDYEEVLESLLREYNITKSTK